MKTYQYFWTILISVVALWTSGVYGQEAAATSAPAPAAVTAVPAAAAPVSPAPAEMAPYVGRITGDNVYVRSGPAEVYYPVTKVNKGQRVVVYKELIGQNNWVKIAPTVGCFCYVAKDFVQLMDAAAGQTTAGSAEPLMGYIKADNVRIRAGSIKVRPENADQVLTMLGSGAPVEIIGERDNFYKIICPANTYFWVAMKYVEKVSPATDELKAELEAEVQKKAKDMPLETAAVPAAAAPAAAPAGTEAAPAAVAEVQPRPAVASSEIETQRREYNELVSAYEAERAKPVASQQFGSILSQVQALAGKAVSASLRSNLQVLQQQVQRSDAAQQIYQKAQQQQEALRQELARIDQQAVSTPAVQVDYTPIDTEFVGRLSSSTMTADDGTALYQVRDDSENILYYAMAGRDRLNLADWTGSKVKLTGVLRYQSSGRQLLYVTNVAWLDDATSAVSDNTGTEVLPADNATEQK